MPGGKKEKIRENLKGEVLTGIYMFSNGDRYEGNYIQTEAGSIERTGLGVHTTADGIIYEGSWENDKFNGKGQLKHPSNASYIGDFVNNQFHGLGKYTWPNGSFYEGPFFQNRIQGEGEFTDTDGQIWSGTFNNKTAHGLKFKLLMD